MDAGLCSIIDIVELRRRVGVSVWGNVVGADECGQVP